MSFYFLFYFVNWAPCDYLQKDEQNGIFVVFSYPLQKKKKEGDSFLKITQISYMYFLGWICVQQPQQNEERKYPQQQKQQIVTFHFPSSIFATPTRCARGAIGFDKKKSKFTWKTQNEFYLKGEKKKIQKTLKKKRILCQMRPVFFVHPIAPFSRPCAPFEKEKKEKKKEKSNFGS